MVVLMPWRSIRWSGCWNLGREGEQHALSTQGIQNNFRPCTRPAGCGASLRLWLNRSDSRPSYSLVSSTASTMHAINSMQSSSTEIMTEYSTAYAYNLAICVNSRKLILNAKKGCRHWNDLPRFQPVRLYNHSNRGH